MSSFTALFFVGGGVKSKGKVGPTSLATSASIANKSSLYFFNLSNKIFPFPLPVGAFSTNKRVAASKSSSL